MSQSEKTVSAALVQKLRNMTGGGIMECRKALLACDGNIDSAVEYLRKQNASIADKKVDRETKEGLVGVLIDGNVGIIARLGSETDFVARNENFQQLLKNILQCAIKSPTNLVEDALKLTMSDGRTIRDHINDAVGLIKENIVLTNIDFIKVNDRGLVTSYMHRFLVKDIGQIGVLLSVESDGEASKVKPIADQIARHCAANYNHIIAISADDVDPNLIEKEREIAMSHLDSSKPQQVNDKIIEGKIKKFLQARLLLEQELALDEKDRTVKQFILDSEKELNIKIKVSGFKILAIK